MGDSSKPGGELSTPELHRQKSGASCRHLSYIDNERFRGDFGNLSIKACITSIKSFPHSCVENPCSELLGVKAPGMSFVS